VNLLQQELENKLRNVLQQINDATATKAAVTKPKTAVSNTVFTVTVAV